ncbi:MAG: DUF454 domain-containing protein [Rhodospirillales bacterium]|nr:DUF454 domain-containing protein [Rhodospirillales bacterium]
MPSGSSLVGASTARQGKDHSAPSFHGAALPDCDGPTGPPMLRHFDASAVPMTNVPGGKSSRWLFLAIGWTCVGSGCLGLVLPLLPTTPFLLLAAWAFGRSSPRWRRWLRHHRRFGSLMRAWEDHRVIPPWAKGTALVAISAGFAWLVSVREWPLWAHAVTAALLGLVAVWIVTRPSRPPSS